MGGNHNIWGRMSGWEGGKLSGVSIGAEQTPQLPRNWVIKSRRKYFFPHYLIWWLSDVEGGVSATMAKPYSILITLVTWYASVAWQFLQLLRWLDILCSFAKQNPFQMFDQNHLFLSLFNVLQQCYTKKIAQLSLRGLSSHTHYLANSILRRFLEKVTSARPEP